MWVTDKNTLLTLRINSHALPYLIPLALKGLVGSPNKHVGSRVRSEISVIITGYSPPTTVPFLNDSSRAGKSIRAASNKSIHNNFLLTPLLASYLVSSVLMSHQLNA